MMSMIDLAFIDAQVEFIKFGDARKLAAWVRDSATLTKEQRDFVADVIDGNVKKPDRRKVKRNTIKMSEAYTTAKIKNEWILSVVGEIPEARALILSEADIYRMIDEHFGYSEGTTRRMNSRKVGQEKK